jgi:hypothetical protein
MSETGLPCGYACHSSLAPLCARTAGLEVGPAVGTLHELGAVAGVRIVLPGPALAERVIRRPCWCKKS